MKKSELLNFVGRYHLAGATTSVKWIAKRVDANEWKRWQSAPGLRVTGKAFGVGRRIPIAQRYND